MSKESDETSKKKNTERPKTRSTPETVERDGDKGMNIKVKKTKTGGLDE